MSLPVEADFAIIKVGDGGSPEVFTTACGIKDVNINRAVNSADRFVRDCTKPGEVPIRKVRVTGKQLDITGSGFIDKAWIATFDAALGLSKNYKVELYIADGTDAGTLMGTFSSACVMTAANMTVGQDQDSTAEITLANNGAWTWVAA